MNEISKIACAGLAGLCMMGASAATNAVTAASGGMLYTPPRGPSILVWDGRTNATPRVLKRFLKKNDPAKVTGPGLAVTTEMSPLKGDAFATAKGRLGEKVAMVVALVNGGATMPRLSVYPEDRVAIVNADRYAALLAEKLLAREIWRAIGFTGGSGYAPYRGCVMQPVFDDAGIAALMDDVLQPMTLQPFRKFEDRFGMKRTHYVAYDQACEEGWAPAPTNAVQKAIWDEVHALPTQPIKILPETKKVGD